MSNTITIEKLPRAEQHGDWHDPLIRWAVSGPGTEIQKFPTRREAGAYAKLRRNSPDQMTAIHWYIGEAI